MNYMGDLVAIIGWILLGGSILWQMGISGLIGYVGGTMLAVGLVLAWREAPPR
ncbi:MAG: hypothetical protein AAF702_33020 [Chloroflexota bacterium]